MKDGKIVVMMAGLSGKDGEGKMAWLAAKAIAGQTDMELYHRALAERAGRRCFFSPESPIDLIPPGNHADVLERNRKEIDLIVDFTAPAAVNHNAELYCAAGIPFVMGTTGGDRKLLVETVVKSDTYAVIATNFSAPVVIFMEMLRMASENFPGGLKGFRLFRKESHQGPDPTRPDFKPKKDPSGTFVASQPFFEELIDAPVTTDQIVMVRDRRVQEFELGVPPEHLDGHAFHEYILRSEDGTVELGFRHDVLGRNTYIPLRAIRFVAAHPNSQGRVFDMLEVLKWPGGK
ncbi:MAG: hypothetical protein NTY04_02645 [Candidatus Staskawiczbacteria bacterium]|nr:hypothetical protein [Candidatus Staskawiczbacteria bacterium]